MIEFKPRDLDFGFDPDIRAQADEDGWLKLYPTMQLHVEDFTICTVRIDGVEYKEATLEFWKAYKKAKVCEI